MRLACADSAGTALDRLDLIGWDRLVRPSTAEPLLERDRELALIAGAVRRAWDGGP